MRWKRHHFYPYLSQGRCWYLHTCLHCMVEHSAEIFKLTSNMITAKRELHSHFSMLGQAQKIHLFPGLLLVTELVSFLGTELLAQLPLHWVDMPQKSLVVTAGQCGHFSEDWCAPCIKGYTPIAGASSQMTPNSMRLLMCCSSHHYHNPVPRDATSTSPVISHFGLMLFLLGDKTSIHSDGFRVRFVLNTNPNSRALNFHLPLLKWRALLESEAGCLLLLPRFARLVLPMEPEEGSIT